MRVAIPFLFASALVSQACATVVTPSQVYEKGAPSAPRVMLLNGSAGDISKRVIASFASSIDFPVSEFVMTDATPRDALADAARAARPALVVALGRRAVDFAIAELPGLPFIYALVVEDESHPINGDKAIGIGLNPAPATEFMMYQLVLSNKLRKVVSLYSPGKSDKLAHQSQMELQELGIELTLLPMDALTQDPNGVQAAVQKSDALWAFNDPGVMSSAGFPKLAAMSVRNSKPLLCSAFRDLAAVGATMVFSLDLENIGGQAASLATEILRRGTVQGGSGMRQPVGGKLVLNTSAMQKLGIDVPEEAQPFISEIVGHSRAAAR